jgi:GMP synthase (glutamine-hydrolysing)
VLILLCGAVPKRLGLPGFDAMFIGAGGLPPGECLVLDATARRPPADFGGFGAAIVTGSLSMVTARPAWSQRLAAWLAKAVEAGLPALGVCYGHHLMAEALGGRAGYHPLGPEIGTFDVTLAAGAESDPLLSGLPAIFPAHMAHSQTVLEIPPGAEVLGRSAHDPHQILRYGPEAWSVQFHPEFTKRIMEGFLRTVGPGRKPPEGRPQGLSAAAARDTPQAASLLKAFLRRRATKEAPIRASGRRPRAAAAKPEGPRPR